MNYKSWFLKKKNLNWTKWILIFIVLSFIFLILAGLRQLTVFDYRSKYEFQVEDTIKEMINEDCLKPEYRN